MGVTGGPNIIRDSSLVLELDAADGNSYVSGSTTWYDVSGYNYSGSLVNGPAFNSANLGSIVFDGSDDYSSHGYISQLYNTKTITYNLWLKWNTTSNRIIIGNENQAGIPGLGIRQRSDNTYWMSPGIGVANIISVIPNIGITTRTHMITALTDGSSGSFYINGQLLGSAAYSTTFTSQTSFYIGIGNNGSTFIEPFLGNIYNVQVYNRALTPTEILQNYNALKSRFNL